MTQAYNLAILANAVDTSGRLNVATNSTGVLPVANGGTGLATTPSNGQIDIGNGSGFTRTTITAGTNISVTNGAGTITIANTSTATGTVTSVATGNGLSGGTITTTGTLVVAAPATNTIGSYIHAGFVNDYNAGTLSYGSTVAASNFRVYNATFADGVYSLAPNNNPSCSGTWRCLCFSNSQAGSTPPVVGLFVRVS
jgi:hypothetical protein